MTVQKLSLSFEPTLAERAREAAEATGTSLSSFVAEAVEHHLKLQEAQALLSEWESANGPISDKELGRARSKWAV